ncbi:MAG TPA: hypothetical protein VFR48_04655 [Solirubrobacteraceae bacterium]|nr:hypothetical protein [Solirubrobacteraceae bacterium]
MKSPRLAKLASFGSVALLAFAAAGTAVAKAPTKGNYQGLTSEKIAVTFEVSAGGKNILNFTTALGYNGKCGQGGGPGFEIKVKAIRVSHGKFSATTKGTLHAAVVVKPIDVKISGHISGKKATGTVAQTGGKNKCTTIDKGANPYSETFTASTK